MFWFYCYLWQTVCLLFTWSSKQRLLIRFNAIVSFPVLRQKQIDSLNAQGYILDRCTQWYSSTET